MVIAICMPLSRYISLEYSSQRLYGYINVLWYFCKMIIATIINYIYIGHAMLMYIVYTSDIG